MNTFYNFYYFRRIAVQILMLFSLSICSLASHAAEESRIEIVSTKPIDSNQAELAVEIIDDDMPFNLPPLQPACVILTDAMGKHPDGSGLGTYADGRFFTEGEFTVTAPPGEMRVQIQSGPHSVPIDQTIRLAAGTCTNLRAHMHHWFAPAALGWYGGDNHVHTQHDKKTTIRVDANYTALQARANGLSFITEADNEVTAGSVTHLNTNHFLYRTAPELRVGPFVGHLNTPGIEHPLAKERYEQLVNAPLPRQRLHPAIRELGGVMIHTHPFTPPHQLHWMGAAEAWSDAAFGKCADLLDLDSPQTEMLWYAMLNLGNRVGCSSYTDCALGRPQTPSPGDRRVYCRAEKLDYRQIVEAMRRGKTVATNGGPLFLDATLADHGIGESITLEHNQKLPLKIQCYGLLPMRTVQLYCGGKRIHSFDLQGRTGKIELQHDVDLMNREADWYVVRAENQKGDWAIASPFYIEPAVCKPETASALLLEISNHTRFIELRRDFYIHMLATVRPPEAIREIRLLRKQQVVKSFMPNQQEQWNQGRVPVTGINGEYEPGWAWHREGESPCHFQADWPIIESGWYALEIVTTQDRTIKSDECQFDAQAKLSHAISMARLEGAGTSLSLWGYGEEMPRSEIVVPFVGDHWWYPQQTFWIMQAQFHGENRTLQGGGNKSAIAKFRPSNKSR